MEEFQENLKEAAKKLQIADHMTYLTYPLINERRILLKIFDEIFSAVNHLIRAALIYESKFSEVNVYKDDETNMENFVNKFSDFFELNENQVEKIREIYEIRNRHMDSAMEFVKRNKIVIMSDNLSVQILDIQRIKEYLIFTRELIKKVSEKLKITNYRKRN